MQRGGGPRGTVQRIHLPPGPGLTSPSIATLVDILQCLGTTINEFFEDPEEQVVFHYEDYFEKEDTELLNKTEWIIPNAQKNMMEPIRLTLKPGGSTYRDVPHEGEEFGYVLKVPLRSAIGKRSTLPKRGIFYFTLPHSRLYRGPKQYFCYHHLGQHAAQFLKIRINDTGGLPCHTN